MSNDVFWQAFEDTGDPMCWLVYKAAENTDNNDGVRDEPQPLG